MHEEASMNKVPMGPRMLFYPRPTFLVGAIVDDKPNFMVVAGGGGVNSEPLTIAVPIQHSRYTLKGIRQNMAFSVNLPSADMAKETDYCGNASGFEVDKVKICGFNLFYGKLDKAPLIEQCPVNAECTVAHMLDLGTHTLVLGRVEEIYCSENSLTDGMPDLNKVNPMIYTTQLRQYLTVGQVVGDSKVISQGLKTGE
jgi:flavin reductase (DIM6/NTAB) family NADH-FMN oxidoreductase RutF